MCFYNSNIKYLQFHLHSFILFFSVLFVNHWYRLNKNLKKKPNTISLNIKTKSYVSRNWELKYSANLNIDLTRFYFIEQIFFFIEMGIEYWHLTHSLSISAYLCAKCKILFDTITIYDEHLENCKNNPDNYNYDEVLDKLTYVVPFFS